jgi:hypothetical protein
LFGDLATDLFDGADFNLGFVAERLFDPATVYKKK